MSTGPEEYEAPETDPELERGRPRKAATAFRTISEVADDLHVPQHVLRFWETRFGQVKPLKRGGGRRYYRPDDVMLLRRISDLLYVQGYTIKGVQRLLREGDGTLEGELPPPDAADRDGEEMPDAPPAPAPARAARASSGPQHLAAAAPDLSAEARALRRILLEVLDELEVIRRQLAV